jgi:hypothetical protein
MTKTKILSARVPQELHALAHMTARSEGTALSKWLENLIRANVKTFFLVPSVQRTEGTLTPKKLLGT